MTRRKESVFFMAGVFAAVFCFCAAVFFAGYRWSERLFYDKMAAVAGAIPGSKEVIMQSLKGA